MPLLERIATKFTVGDDCWQWHAAKTVDGYAQIRVDGKVLKGHRVMYELLVGPIPEGP